MEHALYEALLDKGFPENFCKEVATVYMTTDYTRTRMLGYLYRISDPTIEMVVDEMLAILSDRDAIMKKKEMEATQAGLNIIYREGLQIDDDEVQSDDDDE